jgi:cysteine desulfurase
VRAVPIDFLALSGHKLHAPKGVGLLYVRSGVRFQPSLHGGSQERERRAGTENTASIVAFGCAAELARENLVDEQTRVRKLRDCLEQEILRLIPRVRVNGHRALRLPNTTNLCFDGVEGESLLLKLNQHRICASAGSACTTGSLHPSHVLTAMGLSAVQAQSSLRFSLCTETTEADIATTVTLLPGLVAELRQLVPIGSLATAD